MASLLLKNLTSVNFIFVPSPHRHNLSILTSLFYFSTQAQHKEEFPFIAQYLISSFGFSEDRALKLAACKNLIPIKNPDRPESVIRFLKDVGLNDIQIKSVISWMPWILSKNVRKTFEPCHRELLDAGFTEKTIVQMIRCSPNALSVIPKKLISRLQFWRNFVGNSEEALLKLLRHRHLTDLDIDKSVIPQINLLREYGLSDQQIANMIMKMGYLLTQKPDSIKLHFEQLEMLEFTPGSKMFLEGLIIIGNSKKDTINKKASILKANYGWSQQDVNLAVRKYPRILVCSEENIRSTMDFYIKRAGLNPRSIAMRPKLIGYSLQRRLIPRHYVLAELELKSKGFKNDCSFHNVALMSEKLFVEKYILPYKDELPILQTEYADACAGKIHLS